jgi:hypothetical protein
MTTSAELRAIVEDASTADPFISIAVDHMKSLKGKTIPPRIREVLEAEGSAWLKEFDGWIVEMPDTMVRLGRLRAFSIWCSRINSERGKP